MLSFLLNAGSIVSTGDSFPWWLVFCIFVLLVSAACILFLFLTRKK